MDNTSSFKSSNAAIKGLKQLDECDSVFVAKTKVLSDCGWYKSADNVYDIIKSDLNNLKLAVYNSAAQEFLVNNPQYGDVSIEEIYNNSIDDDDAVYEVYLKELCSHASVKCPSVLEDEFSFEMQCNVTLDVTNRFVEYVYWNALEAIEQYRKQNA